MPKDRDPKCQHTNEAVGIICWPAGPAPKTGPHASTYVCPRRSCQDDAKEWVREVTGHVGVFEPFKVTR